MDNLLPKVAVISIYYNRQNNISDSIQSLIDQTYSNLDIIIVDDCSTDNTFVQLEALSDTTSRIKLFRNSLNKGFTQTLIDTINELEVKYVAIHGAGDISMPTRIEEQVNYLENNSEVGVLTTDLVNLKGQRFNKTEITLNDLLKKNCITHGAVMYRLEVYKKAGGYRSFFRSRQDKDLWFRISLISLIHYYDVKLYKLTKISDSVALNSHISEYPTLLSCYARYLILERIKYGEDSLDRNSEHAPLSFNPSECNNLLYLLLYKSLVSMKFNSALDYINLLLKFNNGFFYSLIFKIFRFILINIQNRSDKDYKSI